MIEGWWYPAGSAARQRAVLSLSAERFQLATDGEDSLSANLAETAVSDRIGNIPRKLRFPDGSVFETGENDVLDSMLRSAGAGAGSVRGTRLHTLESKWRWIGMALIVMLVLGYSSVRWGMPWASEKIAYATPLVVSKMLSDQTLGLLDRAILEPSELPEVEQQRISRHFQRTLADLPSDSFEFNLHFRRMKELPNAFALPSGDIVVTDRLVEIAETQDEIDAVLLHEIGHVVQRHGLQQILHSSLLTISIILISGDINALNNLAVALPVFLLESHYSREHETEADSYAFERMLAANIDPRYFSTIMQRISAELEPKTNGAVSAKNEPVPASERQHDSLDYLSSHPPTVERTRRANEYSRRFHQASQRPRRVSTPLR